VAKTNLNRAELDALTILEGTLRLFQKCCETELVDRKGFLRAAKELTPDEVRLAVDGTDVQLTTLAAKVAKKMGQMH